MQTEIKRGVQQGTKRAPYATKKIETVTINFRVPKESSEAAKAFVRPLLKEWLWFDEYKSIATKHFEDTGYQIEIGEWDSYQQYYIDGYTPRQAFDEDINTCL